MSKKKKKKYKINKKRFTLAIIVALLLLVGLCALITSCIGKGKKNIARTDGFLASAGGDVTLYTGEVTVEKGFFGKVKSREISFTESDSLPRGSKVVLIDEPELDENGNVTYEKIAVGDQAYYIEAGHFAADPAAIVQEKNKYVRTSVTVYEEKDSPKIAGLIKKSSKLDVLGYDYLNEDGSVNMYKISCSGTEGWVFGKYLTDDQASADAMYDEHGEVAIHKEAVYYYELYGGDPLSMDYYPVEKPVFENNKLIEDARTMYLGVGCTLTIDDYISVAKQYGVNAICFDIYDDMLGFKSESAEAMSPTTYKNTYYDADNYGNAIQKVKDAGLYVMGRIIAFKDENYYKDHPENCLSYDGRHWVNPYSRDAWYYKVSLAIEAVRKFGFNEIQFDYVRFPESSYSMSSSGYTGFNNIYDEYKCEAIQNFLFYACDMLHREGVYVSVDVFGESSGGYVTAYGQYWPAMSNIVDVISAMPYVDHFERDASLWENPYNTLYNWAGSAARRQKEIPTPAIARTWITAYDVPYWNPTVVYGANAIADQAQGLWDAGLTGGFLTWNVKNNIDKYRSFSWAWAKDYAN